MTVSSIRENKMARGYQLKLLKGMSFERYSFYPSFKYPVETPGQAGCKLNIKTIMCVCSDNVTDKSRLSKLSKLFLSKDLYYSANIAELLSK